MNILAKTEESLAWQTKDGQVSGRLRKIHWDGYEERFAGSTCALVLQRRHRWDVVWVDATDIREQLAKHGSKREDFYNPDITPPDVVVTGQISYDQYGNPCTIVARSIAPDHEAIAETHARRLAELDKATKALEEPTKPQALKIGFGARLRRWLTC